MLPSVRPYSLLKPGHPSEVRKSNPTLLQQQMFSWVSQLPAVVDVCAREQKLPNETCPDATRTKISFLLPEGAACNDTFRVQMMFGDFRKSRWQKTDRQTGRMKEKTKEGRKEQTLDGWFPLCTREMLQYTCLCVYVYVCVFKHISNTLLL